MSWCQRPCVVPDKSSCHVPYSGKFALGGNFFIYFLLCKQTCFCGNKNCEKIKTEINDVQCEQDGSLHSVCALNGRCREESASYCTNCQQTHRRHSEVVEISSAESFCSTSQFLTHGGRPDTFTQRKTRPLLHKLASSLCRSVLFLRFTCGAWPSTGRGVVRASAFVS